MSIGQGQVHESHFGPVSEFINISEFLQSTVEHGLQLDINVSSSPPFVSLNGPHNAKEEWSKLPEEQRLAIENECSNVAAQEVVSDVVSMGFWESTRTVIFGLFYGLGGRVEDFRDQLNDIVVDPRRMSHATRTHELFVHSIYESADTSNRRKRKRVTVAEPTKDHPDVATLRAQLEGVKLKSWPLLLNSALFIRPPKQSDHNTLIATKRLAFTPPTTHQHQALLFITIYNPVSWGHRLLSRSSQHILLSSQTLGDLVEAIPCSSHEIPEEATAEGTSSWKDESPSAGGKGSVLCVEGVVYGDGQSEKDYAEKLCGYIQSIPAQKRPKIVKGRAMHDVPFASLKIRLHQPYWLAHAGDCEHFFVFERVRLLHPSDPALSSYPLTTHITPPLLDVCRACNKVPALYSVVGDIRLGESPFVICGPCRRWMGSPNDEAGKGVTVVPLPKYEFGWNA